MKTVIQILAVVLFLNSAMLAWQIQHGRHQRRDICAQVNQVRAALYREHQKRLAVALSYRKAHPHGSHDIPLHLLNSEIKAERDTVQDVRPTDCP